MMLSLYVTLGVFLLIAARNPSAHRSIIAFTAWSSFAHALVMGTMAFQFANQRVGFLWGFCRPRGHRRSPYRARAGKGVRRFRLRPCGLVHDNALRSSWSLHGSSRIFHDFPSTGKFGSASLLQDAAVALRMHLC